MKSILPAGDAQGLNKRADLRAARQEPLRPIVGSGRVHSWQSGSVWIGRGRGWSDWHSHHAHQLALALEGEFRFRTDRDMPWTSYRAAIVPSHCPHEFELDDVTVAHLFVEPESRAGRALSTQFAADDVSPLPAAVARSCAEQLLGALRSNADGPAMTACARAAVDALAGTAEPAVGDARVAQALAYIRRHIRAPVSLADAAGAAALSPSRFRHLFVAETGTSFRGYVLWLRINVAIDAAMAGASWTEAAHEAGFADSSHLSRTHKRMFGIEPTAIRHE